MVILFPPCLMELEWDFRWPPRRLLSTALLIWKTGILLDGPLGAKGCFGETMFKCRRHIVYIDIIFVLVVVSAFSFSFLYKIVYSFVFIFVFVFVFVFVFAVVYHWSPGSCDRCTSIPPCCCQLAGSSFWICFYKINTIRDVLKGKKCKMVLKRKDHEKWR